MNATPVASLNTSNNGLNRVGGVRNAVDSSLQSMLLSSFEASDWENNPKSKLYELFILIEKEFESLYAENCDLRSRLVKSSSKIVVDSSATVGVENTPVGSSFSGIAVGSSVAADSEFKSYSKRPLAARQRWRTAFRNPSGRLVTSLKVGGGNLDTTKYRFVQNFRGHTDGIWHVSTGNFCAHQLVASASADHTAKIWLSDDARCVVNYVGHSGSVNSVSIRNGGVSGANNSYSYASDCLMILTTSGDRQSHIWKTSLNNVNMSCGSSVGVTPLEDNDANCVASTTATTLTQSNTNEHDEEDHQLCSGSGNISGPQVIQHPVMRLVGHSDVVVAGEWIFGGEQLITASWDRTANVYDTETGKVINVLSGHDQELTYCSAHSSQKLVATASKDFTFRLWDFREQIQSVAVFQGHNEAVNSVTFTSTHHIVSGSDDRTTKVWDLRNMRCPTSTIRLNSSANTVAVCNKYNLIAIPQDERHISIYDMNGVRMARLPRSNGKCHHRMVCCATWLTDNSTNNLISCGFDKQIIGWKLQLMGGVRN